MKTIKKHIILTTIIIIFLLVLGTIGLKKYLLKTKEIIPTIQEEITLEKEEEKEEEAPLKNVYVDIKGAVTKPGVYEIKENQKVIDVINLAGGFTNDADTSMINLAKKVTNEMVVIIYTKEEVKKWTEPNQIIKYVDKQCICPNIKNDGCLKNESTTAKSEDKATKKEENTKDNKININTATIEELQTISGIGESKAKAIIEYRNDKGEFKNIEELQEVTGIGASLYEKIKDSITI